MSVHTRFAYKPRRETMNCRADIFFLICIVMLLLFTYGFSASSTPLLEDDSLFILASYFTGIAHSPGYPAYVLLSQVSHLLPVFLNETKFTSVDFWEVVEND